MRLRSTLIDALRLVAGLLVLAAVVRMSSSYTAQAFMQEDAPLKLRSDTRVVEIDVTVRDSHGRPVEDLKASDFTVTDNGESRPFTIFSGSHSGPESGSSGPSSESLKGLPQRLALPPNVFSNAGPAAMPPDGHSTIILLDGDNGWLETFANGSKGVLGLLTKLPADEKIAVYVLLKGTGMAVLQDYTLDRSKVEAALTKFVPPGMLPVHATMQRLPVTEGINLSANLEVLGGRISSSPGGRGGGPGQSYSADPRSPTKEFQSIIRRQGSENVQLALSTLAQLLRNVPGRKSVFWVTQGFPPSEIQDKQASWDKTTAALNDSNIAVNTVDTNGAGGPERFQGAGAIMTLEQIAAKTGGQAYIGRNDLDAAMASGIAEARSSYALGFYLTKMDGKFHELNVTVNRPNLQLNYRKGYYAQVDAVVDPVKDASGGKSTLQAALLNPLASTDVKMTAILDIVPHKPKGTLNARLTLEPELLSLKPTGSGYTGKVEELFLEMSADGREVGRYSDSKEFTIPAANKAKFDIEGAVLSQEIRLEANAVNVSIVVRDTASGRTGSLVVPLEKVLNPSAPPDVKITADFNIAPGKPRETLNARLTLDPALLSMKLANSVYSGKVEELFLELDAAGHEVGHYSETKEFTVNAANKDKFDTQGAVLSQTFPLETNAVKVSIVVRDTASGRTGSLVVPIEKATRQKLTN